MRHESMETTHFSVVDGDGMAVSVTYTLEQGYGVGLVVPGGGFLLNNEMGDFNAGPGITTDRGLIGTDPNLARPQQRMLSSMTPSIVARDGKLVAVVGSPGGRTIINTVLQVMLNVIDFGMDIQQAVDAPRLHHQWLPGRHAHRGGRRDRADAGEAARHGPRGHHGRPPGRGQLHHDRPEDGRAPRRGGPAQSGRGGPGTLAVTGRNPYTDMGGAPEAPAGSFRVHSSCDSGSRVIEERKT